MKRKSKKVTAVLTVMALLFTLWGGTGDVTASAKEEAVQASQPSPAAEQAPKATVYMTTDISPEGLMKVYEALNWTPAGKVAVKLSTGEPPASNYLRPELISDLVQYVDGTIVENNTAYGGSRAETQMHYQVAAEGSESLQKRVNGQDGLHTLDHAEKIGLGTRVYEVVDLGE